MKLTFRWYGESDPIQLEQIRQIPSMSGIVTAVYDVAPGGVWPRESIARLHSLAAAQGLAMEVIESVPVHEDIKLGLPGRDRYIEAYCENLKRLGEAGVKCVCYNFMPVFDWTRTQLDKSAGDGSTSLVYYEDQLRKMDPLSGSLSLPGWDSSYRKDELKKLFNAYKDINADRLFENLGYFLRAVIPAAEAAGIVMAIHPDDPPWPIFGLPRIITDERNIDRFLRLVDRPANGLTLCTGSLGSARSNDIPRLAAKYAAQGRIHFVHARNVRLVQGGFEESAINSGSLDMPAILGALYSNGFDGYIRPDHGRMIWGEKGRPGYGLYDRALSAAYIEGVWQTLAQTGPRPV